MISNPFSSRRVSGEDKDTTPEAPSDVPGWVSLFRRWGVPAAAILVLVLCAPGEQHLGDLSGWGYRMSWGLSGLFTLYAGLAAVISTQLPQGARGKTSSVWGAFLSLALAMAAQPVSHMFVTGYISVTPRPPLWLVVSVSSVPPLILGHLLHFAAMGASERPVPVPRDKDTHQTPVATVTRLRPRPVPSPVPAPKASVSRPAVPAASPVLSLTKGTPAVTPPGQPTGQKPSLSFRAMELWADGTAEDKIKEILRAEYTEAGVPPKTNSVTKAVSRAKDKNPRP